MCAVSSSFSTTVKREVSSTTRSSSGASCPARTRNRRREARTASYSESVAYTGRAQPPSPHSQMNTIPVGTLAAELSVLHTGVQLAVGGLVASHPLLVTLIHLRTAAYGVGHGGASGRRRRS